MFHVPCKIIPFNSIYQVSVIQMVKKFENIKIVSLFIHLDYVDASDLHTNTELHRIGHMTVQNLVMTSLIPAAIASNYEGQEANTSA